MGDGRRKGVVQHRQKQRVVYGGNIKNKKRVATCIQGCYSDSINKGEGRT